MPFRIGVIMVLAIIVMIMGRMHVYAGCTVRPMAMIHERLHRLTGAEAKKAGPGAEALRPRQQKHGEDGKRASDR